MDCNNDCDMLTNPAEIELSSNVTKSSSSSRVGSLNPNLVTTTENKGSAFSVRFLNIGHMFCRCFHPQCDSNKLEDAAPLDILGLSSWYKPENEELTYKELLDVCEDVVFELISEQISEIERHTRAQCECDHGSSTELEEQNESNLSY